MVSCLGILPCRAAPFFLLKYNSANLAALLVSSCNCKASRFMKGSVKREYGEKPTLIFTSMQTNASIAQSNQNLVASLNNN